MFCLQRKRDGKLFARDISMVKKYKHISDSDDHSDIDSSSSAEMNTENTHPDDRGSNKDSVENVDSAKNVRRLSRTRNLPIRFGKAYIHWKNLRRWGGYVVYAMDFGWALYIWTLCMDFVYELCIYFGRGLFLVNWDYHTSNTAIIPLS